MIVRKEEENRTEEERDIGKEEYKRKRNDWEEGKRIEGRKGREGRV